MAENLHKQNHNAGWAISIGRLLFAIANLAVLVCAFVFNFEAIFLSVFTENAASIAEFLFYCIIILITPILAVQSLHLFLKERKIRKKYSVFSGKYLQKTVEHHSDDETGETRVWYEHYLTVEVAPNQVMEKIYCNKEISDTLKRGDRLVMMYYKDGSVFVIKKGLPTE